MIDNLHQLRLLDRRATPAPWSSSGQKGNPGHCFAAQVFGPDDESLLCMESTEDQRRATDDAGLIAQMRNALPGIIKELDHLRHQVHFYRSRIELLQSVQSRMGDPARTLVCDVIANGVLLPDAGDRYGFPVTTMVHRSGHKTLREPSAEHPDDAAVDRFAGAMKSKLAQKRAEGRGGWEDHEQCGIELLQKLLANHVEKGDPVDVGNLAMMLWNRGGSTARAEPSAEESRPDLRSEVTALRDEFQCADTHDPAYKVACDNVADALTDILESEERVLLWDREEQAYSGPDPGERTGDYRKAYPYPQHTAESVLASNSTRYVTTDLEGWVPNWGEQPTNDEIWLEVKLEERPGFVERADCLGWELDEPSLITITHFRLPPREDTR